MPIRKESVLFVLNGTFFLISAMKKWKGFVSGDSSIEVLGIIKLISRISSRLLNLQNFKFEHCPLLHVGKSTWKQNIFWDSCLVLTFCFVTPSISHL